VGGFQGDRSAKLEAIGAIGRKILINQDGQGGQLRPGGVQRDPSPVQEPAWLLPRVHPALKESHPRVCLNVSSNFPNTASWNTRGDAEKPEKARRWTYGLRGPLLDVVASYGRRGLGGHRPLEQRLGSRRHRFQKQFRRGSRDSRRK